MVKRCDLIPFYLTADFDMAGARLGGYTTTSLYTLHLLLHIHGVR